jgi:hypothetical protein
MTHIQIYFCLHGVRQVYSNQPSETRPHQQVLRELRIERNSESRKLNELRELLRLMPIEQSMCDRVVNSDELR